MNAYAHDFSSPAPSPAWALPFTIMQTTIENFLDTQERLSRMMTLPYDVYRAVETAKEKERLSSVTLRQNNALTFGIASVEIKGTTTPVKTDFVKISPTCDMWQFHCHNKETPTIVLVAPVSGSHPLVMKDLAHGLLQNHNVVVVGTPDPHHLPDTVPFDVNQQINDVIQSLIYLNQSSRCNFVLVGTSQSGPIVAAAAGITAANPTYQDICPAAVVLNVAPMDTGKGNTALNWMARYHNIPKDIFIHINDDPTKREILPYGVMKVLYSLTSDKVKYEASRQDIAADHVRQMHQLIFQENRLAQGTFLHDSKRVCLPLYKGKLVTIAGDTDTIVPAAQTHAAKEMFKGVAPQNYFQCTIKGASHYDTIQKGKGLNEAAALITQVVQRIKQQRILAL